MKIKFVAIVTSLVLLFSGLIALLWGWTYSNRLISLHSDYATQATDQASEDIEDRLHNIYLLAYSLRFNEGIQEVLRKVDVDEGLVSLSDMSVMRQTLSSVMLNAEYVTSAVISTESGITFFSGSSEHLSEEVLRTYIRRAQGRDACWVIEDARDAYGYPTLVLVMRSRLPRQRPMAWLIVRIRCREMLYNLNNATHDRSTLLVQDPSGQVLHADNLWLFDAADAGQIADALAKPAASGGGTRAILGQRAVVIQSQLSIVPWHTSVLMPLNEIARQYSNILRYNLMLLAAILLAAILLTLLIAQRFLRNIRILTEGVERVSQTHMRLELPIRSHDEVAVLYRRFREMMARLDQQMLDNMRAEREKRLLGIRALQAQINPHFLYNTLNTIKLLAKMQGASSVVEASDALSNIMQTNMSRHEYLTFAEEIEYLRKYISLKEYQTADRIRFIAEIEPGLESCYVLKMLLQPLVENALKHGGVADTPEGYVSVRVFAEGGDIRAQVEDNGMGLSEEESRQILANLKNTESIGLFNITQRLRLHYGEHYGVSIHGEKDVYTCVSLLLPRLERLEESHD